MSESSLGAIEPMTPFICNVGEVTFRPAEPRDEEFLLRLYAGTRELEMALVPWDEAQKANFLSMQFAAQTQHYREHYPAGTHDIVLLNGQPVGRLYVAPTAEALVALDLLIVADQRGQGIGTPIVRQLMARAQRLVLPLRIHVEINNRSLNLFERLGFTNIETSDFHWLMEWKPV